MAQLEDAVAAREAKREAYLVHRLEASAADKIREHRRWATVHGWPAARWRVGCTSTWGKHCGWWRHQTALFDPQLG